MRSPNSFPASQTATFLPFTSDALRMSDSFHESWSVTLSGVAQSVEAANKPQRRISCEAGWKRCNKRRPQAGICRSRETGFELRKAGRNQCAGPCINLADYAV